MPDAALLVGAAVVLAALGAELVVEDAEPLSDDWLVLDGDDDED